jgi:hypothetical protein
MIPIELSEVFLRRVPQLAEYYDSKTKELQPLAYNPNRADVTGLSLVRHKFKSPKEAAAMGKPGKSYYVVCIRARDLIAARIKVEPDTTEDWHAELPDLRYDNRRSDEARSLMDVLAGQLTYEILGPFPGSSLPGPK